MRPTILLLAAGAAVLSFSTSGTTQSRAGNSRITTAMSAAPASIGRGATIVEMSGHGMTTLRRGSNGWTCIPDDPATPGPDPMCVDANGAAWMHASMMGAAPPAGRVGLAYMLRGGADASNTDPSARRPGRGGHWVMTGPHLMILSREVAEASGYPSGQASPDTSRPYVMFGGTPYAHIMMPVR